MTETRTEADMLGGAMARVVGQSVQELEAYIKRLERQLDVAADPHTVRCATQATRWWEDCDCGLRALREPRP